MRGSSSEGAVPGYRLERVVASVQRFRKSWHRVHRPQDVNNLLGLFPHVSLQRGYVLDYLPMGGEASRWIWPFIRQEREIGPPPELASLARDYLIQQRDSGKLRPVVAETLYQYMIYERSPVGLLEYALFVSELWATKSESVAGEWLSLEPLLTRRAYDDVLRKTRSTALRFSRPLGYDPLVELSPEGGGAARMLVYHPGDWKRIYVLRLLVAPEGEVRRSAGELVANLGGGPEAR